MGKKHNFKIQQLMLISQKSGAIHIYSSGKGSVLLITNVSSFKSLNSLTIEELLFLLSNLSMGELNGKCFPLVSEANLNKQIIKNLLIKYLLARLMKKHELTQMSRSSFKRLLIRTLQILRKLDKLMDEIELT